MKRDAASRPPSRVIEGHAPESIDADRAREGAS